jgi:hypothetical protein
MFLLALSKKNKHKVEDKLFLLVKNFIRNKFLECLSNTAGRTVDWQKRACHNLKKTVDFDIVLSTHHPDSTRLATRLW